MSILQPHNEHKAQLRQTLSAFEKEMLRHVCTEFELTPAGLDAFLHNLAENTEAVRRAEKLSSMLDTPYALPCFHCREDVSEEDPSWLWSGSTFIRMHIFCYVDWLNRQTLDIAAATVLLEHKKAQTE